MRWERLFADLEAQAEALEAAEFAGEVAERTRHEIGALRLLDRLRAAEGHTLRMSVLGGDTVVGAATDVGVDWLLLAERPEREALVALAAVTSVGGLGRWTAAPAVEGRLARSLDLRYVLRGITRDRSGVQATLVDGSSVVGTLDRVGADFVELAEHPAGEPRRAGSVRAVRVLPITAIAVLRAQQV